MKKLISIIIAAVICFGCVIPAFADMGGPTFKEYTAYVINPDGVTYEAAWSDEDIYVPYKTEVRVTGEYDGTCWCDFEGRSIEIKMEDLSKVEDTVDSSEAIKLSDPITYVIIAEEGAKIRKGPAESYDEVGTIPCNTEITVSYGIEEASEYNPWGYCTYDGVSGWINVYQYYESFDIATKLTTDTHRTGKIVVLKEGIKLLDKVGIAYSDDEADDYGTTPQSKYISDSIPVGTEFTYDTFYMSARAIFAYVEYNGVKGWLSTEDEDEYCPSTETTDDTINDIYIYNGSADIYSDIFGEGEKLGTIPENSGVVSYLGATKGVSPQNGQEIFDVSGLESYEYTHVRTYYVEYNGVKGWITTNYDGTGFRATNIYDSDTIKLLEDATAYEKINKSGASEQLKADTEYICLGRDWNDSEDIMLLVDKKLMFMPDSFEFEYTDNSFSKEDIETKLFGKPLEIDYSIVNISNPEYVENEEADTEKIYEKDTQKSFNTMIIVIVVVVILLAVVSLVTIILIKKKKEKAKASDQ